MTDYNGTAIKLPQEVALSLDQQHTHRQHKVKIKTTLINQIHVHSSKHFHQKSCDCKITCQTHMILAFTTLKNALSALQCKRCRMLRIQQAVRTVVGPPQYAPPPAIGAGANSYNVYS